ncbi:secreted protein [Melampsora americana]|nr:secreted protein [Melampsora americana]
MQRILSLPVLALLALALSTLIANGSIDRRQAASTTLDSKTPTAATTPRATATDIKPAGAETRPAANATDAKTTANTTAVPATTGATTASPSTPGSANRANSSVSDDKSTNTTKTPPPAGAKNSSAGQTNCNLVVPFVVGSLSLFAALFA